MNTYFGFILASIGTMRVRGQLVSEFSTVENRQGVYRLVDHQGNEQFFSSPFKAVLRWHEINMSRMRREYHWI